MLPLSSRREVGIVADGSSIEWTQATWNPTTGCDKVSAGCDNCYALTLAKRLKAMGADKYQHDGDPRTSGPGFGITVHPDALGLPYMWRTPRLVFVNSMSDLSVGVVIEDSMIAAGHRHNLVSTLCPTSVADGSRRTSGRASPFHPAADRQQGQAEQHRPGEAQPHAQQFPWQRELPGQLTGFALQRHGRLERIKPARHLRRMGVVESNSTEPDPDQPDHHRERGQGPPGPQPVARHQPIQPQDGGLGRGGDRGAAMVAPVILLDLRTFGVSAHLHLAVVEVRRAGLILAVLPAFAQRPVEHGDLSWRRRLSAKPCWHPLGQPIPAASATDLTRGAGRQTVGDAVAAAGR